MSAPRFCWGIFPCRERCHCKRVLPLAPDVKQMALLVHLCPDGRGFWIKYCVQEFYMYIITRTRICLSERAHLVLLQIEVVSSSCAAVCRQTSLSERGSFHDPNSSVYAEKLFYKCRSELLPPTCHMYFYACGRTHACINMIKDGKKSY